MVSHVTWAIGHLQMLLGWQIEEWCQIWLKHTNCSGQDTSLMYACVYTYVCIYIYACVCRCLSVCMCMRIISQIGISLFDQVSERLDMSASGSLFASLVHVAPWKRFDSSCLTSAPSHHLQKKPGRSLQVCYSMEGKDSPYGVENTNQAFWLTPEGHITCHS